MSVLDGIVDTRPLRSHPGFRRLWIGTTTSSFSRQVAVVAVLYQVWQLTHSAAWVGAIGVATAVPTIIFGLLGGALADAVDRRRLVMLTSTGAVAAAVLLAVQAGTSVRSLPLVLILVAAQTACSALGASARRTFVPRLLPREQVPAGIALNHVSFQAAMLVGPAVAGLVLTHWGDVGLRPGRRGRDRLPVRRGRAAEHATGRRNHTHQPAGDLGRVAVHHPAPGVERLSRDGPRGNRAPTGPCLPARPLEEGAAGHQRLQCALSHDLLTRSCAGPRALSPET